MNKARRRPEKLLALVLLGFILAVGMGGYGYSIKQRAAFEKAAGDQLNAIADLKRSQIDRWLEERKNDVHWVMDSPPVVKAALEVLANPSDVEGDRLVLAMMTAWKRDNRYGRVVLLDSRAQIRLSVPPEQNGIGVSAGNYAAAALRSNELLMSDLQLDEQTHLATMNIFAPLRMPGAGPDGAPETWGVFMFEIDPYEFLFPHIQTWPTRSFSAETLLVRREGNEVVYLNELRHRSDTALKLRFPIKEGSQLPAVRAVQGAEGIVKGVDYRGVPVLASLRSIPHSAWFMVAKQDQAEIYAPLTQLLWTVGMIVGLLILASSLGIGFLWRNREFEFARDELEEHKRAEASLRSSEERYRLLFEQMIAGFAVHELICDASGKPCDYRYLKVNPAFEKLTGLSADTVTGKRVLEVLPSLEPSWVERYGRVALTGEPIHFEDYNRELDKYFEVRAFRPEVGKFAVMFQDVTQRRQAERERERLTGELERKNEELEHVIYAASHDLRSPLVNIEGFSKRLEKSCLALARQCADLPLPDKRRTEVEELTGAQIPKSLGYIRLGVAKMNTLIAGLLHLSRLGHVALHPELLDMNRLLREVAAAQAFQLQKSNAQVEIEILPSCHGDAPLINQVFSNLVDNALKYRDDTRPLHIRISGQEDKGQSVYCVADTGIGIAPEDRRKIWELFHRLDPLGPVTGDGLGLNLIRRILDRHHGRAWVESTLGEGSRFFVSLPKTADRLV
jgi:PAS domain S-box-containing protein